MKRFLMAVLCVLGMHTANAATQVEDGDMVAAEARYEVTELVMRYVEMEKTHPDGYEYDNDEIKWLLIEAITDTEASLWADGVRFNPVYFQPKEYTAEELAEIREAKESLK